MIIAQYRGNSSPGQLADSSGNGYDLVVAGGGSVPNPSTPTPPEGDSWLAGPSVDGVSRLEAPIAVASALVGTGSVEGKFRSSLGTELNRALDDVLISFNKDVDNFLGKLILVMDSTAPLGQIRIYFFQNLPPVNTASHNFVDSGQDHSFRLEWSPTGTRLYLDEILVASTAIQPVIPVTNKPSIAGYEITGTSDAMDYGYLDDVIFRDGASESSSVELVQARRRRR